MDVERFEQYLEEHRLIGNKWLDTNEEGLETACFVAALAPEGADRTDPAALGVPPWIGHVLVWLDDSSRDQAEREERARRLVPVLRRLEDPQYGEALRRCDFECRATALRSARERVVRGRADAWSLDAVDRVLDLLSRVASGGQVDPVEWRDARLEASLASEGSVAQWAVWATWVTWVPPVTSWASDAPIADAWLTALERAVGLSTGTVVPTHEAR